MAAVLVETLIEVYENNDTPLEFDLVQDDGSPYVVTGATIEFYIKSTNDETDAEATKIDGVVEDGPNGTISVEIPAGACATPGAYRHRCDAIIGGKRRTVMAGPLVVRNV